MNRLIFATQNKHKIDEINRINLFVQYQSLIDVGMTSELPETGHSFRENAEQKARYVFEETNLQVVAEDSGLVVHSLGGEPGIYSARYAGSEKNHEKNIKKLLCQLESKESRLAYFISTICLIDLEGNSHFFEGKCGGRIHHEIKGSGGFGYDPVFIPHGHGQTFGELPTHIKDNLSHRRKAFDLFIAFYLSINKNDS